MSSVAQTWNVLADSYDFRYRDTVYMSGCHEIVKRLGHVHGRVLDAGAGTGIVTEMLARWPYELHAIDFSERSIDLLARKVPTAIAQTGDIRALPYPDAYFDGVVCANTLQHFDVHDQRIAVAELLRVLKPGGRFAFSMHHYSRAKERGGWTKEGKPGQPGVDYIYRYTRAEVRALLPHARVIACSFYGWPRLTRMLSAYVGGLAARVRADGHMLVAFGNK